MAPNRKHIQKLGQMLEAYLSPDSLQRKLPGAWRRWIGKIYRFSGRRCPKGVVKHLEAQIPGLREILGEDMEALFRCDPACLDKREVAVTYPGYWGMVMYRFAHLLWEAEVPLLPRMLTEYAHQMTGIDIHPGAVIGKGCAIDHGTGVVIGETARIGEFVTIYQGVTVGAKFFPKDERGCPIKGGKRHPTIEDGVVIYANATILGGDTVVGRGAVIGGNVFLTHSVPAHSKVFFEGR